MMLRRCISGKEDERFYMAVSVESVEMKYHDSSEILSLDSHEP